MGNQKQIKMVLLQYFLVKGKVPLNFNTFHLKLSIESSYFMFHHENIKNSQISKKTKL